MFFSPPFQYNSRHAPEDGSPNENKRERGIFQGGVRVCSGIETGKTWRIIVVRIIVQITHEVLQGINVDTLRVTHEEQVGNEKNV